MARATSVLLLSGGTLLLVIWLVSPADSAPQLASPRPRVAEAPLPPELEDVNAQVERLRARLDQVVEFPEPSRDPFRFAPRPRASRPVAEISAPVVPVAAPIMVEWPSLVAILTTSTGGEMQAALSSSDELHVIGVGGRIGTFTVSEISADTIQVTDSVSGQSTRLVLR